MTFFARVVSLLILVCAPVSARDEKAASPVRALGNAFASVYERVAPSVVVLEVAKQEGMTSGDAAIWDLFFQGRDPQLDPRLEESEGSGFIIREDGYILTNAHVVARHRRRR